MKLWKLQHVKKAIKCNKIVENGREADDIANWVQSNLESNYKSIYRLNKSLHFKSSIQVALLFSINTF